MADGDNGKTGVIVQRAAAGLLIAEQGLGVRDWPGTLGRDEAGIKARLNAMGSSTLDFDRDGSILLELCDVIAYPREDMDEDTGELRQFSWLVLISTDGERFGTSSPVVAHKIAHVVREWAFNGLPRPITVQVVKRTARRSGRTYHDVVIH